MTRNQLVRRMRELKAKMLDVASEMDYFGGFGETSERGLFLARSAWILGVWADDLDNTETIEAEK